MLELNETEPNQFKLNKNQVLKKERDKYRIVYPIKTEGKLNWKNLIAPEGFTKLIFMLILVIGIILILYNARVNRIECENIISNLDEICEERTNQITTPEEFTIQEDISFEYETRTDNLQGNI
jgi:hypothetical protein